MQITIQTLTAGTPTILIDGPDRAVDKTMGPISDEGSSTIEVQPRRPMRSASSRPLSRANRTENYTYRGVRKCASAETAMAWVSNFLATCPRKDIVKLIVGTDTTTLSDAVLERIEYKRTGLLVYLTFTIKAGAIT